jgi:hypothetical protein
MQQQEISRFELARYIICPSLFVMPALMIVEAMLTATTTWLVINAGRKVASGQRPALDPERAIDVVCGRRHQLDFRRACRLSRPWAIHAALCARKPRQGQVVRRQVGARTG